MSSERIPEARAGHKSSTRHLPLIGIDLAGSGHVAYHPPVEGEHASSGKALKDQG